MPLTVAVVGAGPAGLYLAESLLRQETREVRVDLFERLPTPFGLLRYGVAPDHLKIKAVGLTLQRTLEDPRVCFHGDVEVGRDLAAAELREHYSAVVYTYGASGDRELGVPGEDLAGVTSAAPFVEWYSGHPDRHDAAFPLTGPVVVVGAGNVALDVTRIVAAAPDHLATTDMPDPVLGALRDSRAHEVHVLVRRGPAHVRFTAKELRELGELDGVDMVVDPADLELDPTQQALVDAEAPVRRNVAAFSDWSQRPRTDAPRSIHLHFWTSPVAFEGDGLLSGVRVVTRAGGFGEPVEQVLPAALAVRCVGYRGAALEGVPFDEETGTVPTRETQVLRDGVPSPGEYAAGWIGHGPVGVLGTNRKRAAAVVARMLLDDLPERHPWDVDAVLLRRGTRPVDGEGWLRIDRAEQEAGASQGRARAKIATWAALREASLAGPRPGATTDLSH